MGLTGPAAQMPDAPDLYVTNFNRNYTGVSATAAAVVREQAGRHNLRLVGQPLPGCPEPISLGTALRETAQRPPGKPFAIWHVRRNTEMRAAILARDILRLPVRTVFTSAAQRRHSLFPRFLISRMDAVVATSEAAAAFVPHVRAVAPHGVDTQTFHPATDRRAAWAATGHGGLRGVATIGRVRPEKGTDIFVDAMIRALPALPGTTALVVGKATAEHRAFEARLKARVAEAGLGDRIVFTGEVAADEMPALVRALDLLVALPRYEGYGVTPLEAMASGVPFVASETGHFREFAGNVRCGEIVPVGDAEAASTAIVDVLHDAARHDAMGDAARKRVVESFSVVHEADMIDTVYGELWCEQG